MITLDTVAALRAGAVRDIEVTFAHPVTAAAFAGMDGRLRLDADGTTLTGQITGSPDTLVKALAAPTVTSLRATEPALEEPFAVAARMPMPAHWKAFRSGWPPMSAGTRPGWTVCVGHCGVG